MSKSYKYYQTVLNILLVAFLAALIVAFAYRLYRQTRYEHARSMITQGQYSDAEAQFRKLGNYRDCKSYLSLLSAIDFLSQDQFEDAIFVLESLGDFPASQGWLFKAHYKYAHQLYNEGNFSQATEEFSKLLDEASSVDWEGIEWIDIKREDIKNQLDKSRFAYGQELYVQKQFGMAVEVFSKLEDYEELGDHLSEAKYAYGQQLYSQMDYLSAAQIFEELDNYKESQEWTNKSKYGLAMKLMDQGEYITALNYFLDLGNYERSAQNVEEILDSDITVDPAVLYKAAQRHFDTGLYWRALAEFQSLGGYNDSEKGVEETKKKIRESLSASVSVGQSYTVAINCEGEALTTGFDPEGRSNITNANWTDLISISAFSDVTAGLKSDGTVITTSRALNNEIGKDDSPWRDADIVAISVGNSYIVGLASDGTLKSAGHDEGDGQRDVEDWTDIVSIATGWRHTVALKSTGDILITGYGSTRQLNQIQLSKDMWTDIIAIAAGGGDDVGNGHTVGLRRDGRVVAVGDNSFNQCEVEKWENIIAIAAGDWFTIGLDKDGKIFITKPNEEKIREYGLYTDVLNAEKWTTEELIAIYACGGSAVGLYSDGHVIASGYSKYNQRDIANSWNNIMVLS